MSKKETKLRYKVAAIMLSTLALSFFILCMKILIRYLVLSDYYSGKCTPRKYNLVEKEFGEYIRYSVNWSVSYFYDESIKIANPKGVYGNIQDPDDELYPNIESAKKILNMYKINQTYSCMIYLSNKMRQNPLEEKTYVYQSDRNIYWHRKDINEVWWVFDIILYVLFWSVCVINWVFTIMYIKMVFCENK